MLAGIHKDKAGAKDRNVFCAGFYVVLDVESPGKGPEAQVLWRLSCHSDYFSSTRLPLTSTADSSATGIGAPAEVRVRVSASSSSEEKRDSG